MATHWYFDFISPFAYLAWPRVRALAARHDIALRPIMFAGLLGHHGHKGPAEIAPKRTFTYRHVLWQAKQRGVPLAFPPTHPFNPLLALRLCVAAGTTPEAITAIFDWIWAQGRAADDPEAIAPLAAALGVDDASALSSPAVKETLRANYDAALAEGVFGVPTLVIDGEVFWGDDAMDFAEAFLADPGLLSTPEMQAAADWPVGIRRA
ncbi:MAG TPA: 2-hydroxychromene-2-carboxylate isomerase [Arenimonas sp.]|uniref:2-hydroxychromene-2-carboxylate isomerase n=1 Tax=Arenimonas sp. TaxID=1872635 RepID=UPI002D7F5BFE|nr:2-hydroxychromene-2-carboxylate isomerase [Arenimonas sp.]HEU0154343.1 2-hydroxychromene-2-carboxylate isomerase [Arenimonas sp.]